ncbi:nucleotidyl transferase AbiEii/AbiGii toxin family protein [Azospirillum canadense]|uniref:nucleotidyl transferase AbiEii/AbiGii toxin family protein n=1 Tax=Azospirillum canadense TaxID=403962 RepID=UPI002227D893|nr:nucleotidyl transferase AbiEii/AbiGii toxin family protein [Azospirillum canadense]MCW2240763.1 hypothetical protein [Azospirillum canadense]
MAAIAATERLGVRVPGWTFGGGTALMAQHQHRESQDIDIFLPDPQLLPFLSPRLNDAVDAGAYREAAHYLKLSFDEGAVDFIAAGSFTDIPPVMAEIGAHTVPLEHPVEIALKKLYHRGEHLSPRDVFDVAVVLHEHEAALVNQLPKLAEMKTPLIKRLNALPEPYLAAALDELVIFERWEPLRRTALPAVKALVDAVPEPAAKSSRAPVSGPSFRDAGWWRSETPTPSRPLRAYLDIAAAEPSPARRLLALMQAVSVAHALETAAKTAHAPFLRRCRATTEVMRADLRRAHAERHLRTAAGPVYMTPEAMVARVTHDLTTTAADAILADVVRSPERFGDLRGAGVLLWQSGERRQALSKVGEVATAALQWSKAHGALVLAEDALAKTRIPDPDRLSAAQAISATELSAISASPYKSLPGVIAAITGLQKDLTIKSVQTDCDLPAWWRDHLCTYLPGADQDQEPDEWGMA